MRFVHKPVGRGVRSFKLSQASDQAGFSFAAVLVVLLIVLTGSVSLALRGGSGQLSAALQARKRSAQQVADAGATQIIGELNKLPNRRMLVSGRPMGTGANSWGDASDGQQRNNRCHATYPRTTLATTIGNGNPRGLLTGATTDNAQYTLLKVRYSDRLRTQWTESGENALPPPTPPFANDNLVNPLINLDIPETDPQIPNTGYIELTVLGQVFDDDGEEVSRATITREFQVIPKSCGRSFHDSYPDNDGVNEYGNDALFADLSIRVFGSPGVETASGTNINLVTPEVDENGNYIAPQTAIICVRDDAGDCLTNGGLACVNDTVTGDSICDGVPVVTINNLVVNPLTVDAPPRPSTPTLPAPPVSPAPPTIINSTTYLRVRASDQRVERCATPDPFASPISLTCDPVAPAFCGPRDTSTDRVADFHCLFRQIDIGANEQLIVDTTPAGGQDVSIAFYFEGSPTTGKSMQVATDGALLHRKCDTSTGVNGCGTPAGLVDYVDFAIYGKNTNATPMQNFEISGASTATGSEPLAVFVYNRFGDITLGGGFVDILGALWSQTLNLSGNVTVVAPPVNIPGDDNDPNEYFNSSDSFHPINVFFDWIARSTTKVRYFN